MRMQKRAVEATARTPLPADRAFVVQMAAAAQPQVGHWEGRVEHIASGAACRFHSATELLEFVSLVLAGENGGRR